MASVTSTVSVNPAFLQEFKEDNHELRQLLHHSTAMLSRPRGMRVEARRLVELLEKLRDQLAMHFALEEFYGYFDEELSENPRLGHRADELRSQHAPLFLELCDLAEVAQELMYESHLQGSGLRQIARRFAAFRQQFQRHEEDENALILAAFDEEMGSGD